MSRIVESLLKTLDGITMAANADPLHPRNAADLHAIWERADRLMWAELAVKSGLVPASATHPISPVHRRLFLEELEARSRAAA